MAEIGKDIVKAKALLENDDLVAIPTETVYGLAGNGFSAKAASRIFEVKQRPAFDPLILHTSNLEKVKDFIEYIPEQANLLADKFWPGPLTLLLHKKHIVPDLVTSGLETVAVRIPRHPLTHELLENLDFPLAAPSANPFGYISPTTPEHVNDQLGSKIKYILDGGPCKVGLESTIVGFESDEAVIHRLGGMDISMIEAVIGKVNVLPHSSSNPKAPGMLKSHYAPTKPLILGKLSSLLPQYDKKDIAVLSFRNKFDTIADDRQITLSESGDLEEAATQLFSALRTLDSLPVKAILAEEVPSQGLGLAINDRLKRAAAK